MFKLEKIILFGSYARGTWVEDGYVKDGITYEYKSDFDILVVTTEVNIIHHGIQFLNKKIEENYYFFTDIAEEGVLLYDTGQYKLATPGPMTPEAQGQKAQEEFEYWLRKGDRFYESFEFNFKKEYYSESAFLLHQATESYYSAILLVFTDYRPRGHNLKWLGKQANSINDRFREVFPNRNREERALF